MEFICSDCNTPLIDTEDAFISLDTQKVYCAECKNNHDNTMEYSAFEEMEFEAGLSDEFDGDLGDFGDFRAEGFESEGFGDLIGPGEFDFSLDDFRSGAFGSKPGNFDFEAEGFGDLLDSDVIPNIPKDNVLNLDSFRDTKLDED